MGGEGAEMNNKLMFVRTIAGLDSDNFHTITTISGRSKKNTYTQNEKGKEKTNDTISSIFLFCFVKGGE